MLLEIFTDLPQSITIWIAIMATAIFAHSLISIITTAQILGASWYYDYAGRMVAYWFSCFFNALSFVAIIFIARNATWNSATAHVVEPNSYGAGEQQYAYDYQQPPVGHPLA